MAVLDALDGEFLSGARCLFGGGTRTVLELDEYRESIDVDFLCAGLDGYRAIRSAVSARSFGPVFRDAPELLRDIRADRYGIRSYLRVDGQPLKIEIVSEGRIALGGMWLPALPVEALDHHSALAEKLLANADRGRDDATLSRDLVDLAFMAARWKSESLGQAMRRAESAYGTAVRRELSAALTRFAEPSWRARCLNALDVVDERPLDDGLARLVELVPTSTDGGD